jgi:hypothetical protein
VAHRRGIVEVVTTKSRRIYQADSQLEADLWKKAIQMQIEALLNGSSSIRTFDASRIQGLGDSTSELGEKFPTSTSSPKQLFSGLVRKASGHKRKGSSPNILQRGFGKRLSSQGFDLGQLAEATASQLSFATSIETEFPTPMSSPQVEQAPAVPFKTTPKLGSEKEWTSKLHMRWEMPSDSWDGSKCTGTVDSVGERVAFNVEPR